MNNQTNLRRAIVAFYLLFAAFLAGMAWQFRNGPLLLFALLSAAAGIYNALCLAAVWRQLYLFALSLSTVALRMAQYFAHTAPGAVFTSATICGHTSPDDPADAPVTISDLLGILDRSRARRQVTLIVPGYRITASTVTELEHMIESRAGREGMTPEAEAWIAPALPLSDCER